MITVRMTIDDEQGLQEFQSFHADTQSEKAASYKSAHPDENVILYHVQEDGTKLYGPIIEQAESTAMAKRRQMPFVEYYGSVPNSSAFYKDCLILDFYLVSKRYVLLTLQIPLPAGGTYEELAEISTTVIEID